MHSFLCTVNAYQIMWPKWGNLLKPLSDESCKKTFYWSLEIKGQCIQNHASYPGCRYPYGTPHSSYTIPQLHQCFWLPNGCCNHPTNWPCKLTEGNKITIPWWRNSSQLPWSLKNSIPCFLLLCFSNIPTTQIYHLLLLTGAASYTGIFCGRVWSHQPLSSWL